MLSKEFFNSLQDGEEYLNVFMTKDTYSVINEELRPLMVLNQVRQKNSSFVNDDNHKELLKNKLKADKAIIDYEFNTNNK